MERRKFLGVCSAALTGTAGCQTRPDSHSPTDSSPNTTDTQTRTTTGANTPSIGTTASPSKAADPIEIIVNNARSETLKVDLSLTRDAEQVFGRTLTVTPNDRRIVNSQIQETGAYELTITLSDGSEVVRPFSVEDYDLRSGSNLIVEIGENIRVLMEE